MKVLVTGATGFIGNFVIRELLKRGVDIIASSTSIENAKKKSWFGNVNYVAHNIQDIKEDLFQKFQRPDALIHLAWRGLPNYKMLFHIEEELMTQYFFLKSMVEGGLKNMNITGTCFEYGMQEGCLNEEMSSAPDNNYSVAKDTLREFLFQLKKKVPFSIKWLRLFYMFGDGQNESSILPQLQKAIDNKMPVFNMSLGEQIRDYLSAEIMARYIVDCALQTEVDGIINVSSNRPIKIIDLVTKYLSDRNTKISLNLGFYPYPDYEPFAFWGDDTKLKRVTTKE